MVTGVPGLSTGQRAGGGGAGAGLGWAKQDESEGGGGEMDFPFFVYNKISKLTFKLNLNKFSFA